MLRAVLAVAMILAGLTPVRADEDEKSYLAALPCVYEEYDTIIINSEEYGSGDNSWTTDKMYFVRRGVIIDSRSVHEGMNISVTTDENCKMTGCVEWSDYGTAWRVIRFKNLVYLRGETLDTSDPQGPWWAANRNMRALKAAP